ncbi:hypothetical protein Mapa_016841 [Marchantia paleacea]|nr:hypothetical protein Mapa_016841 [Marchantia paleacea]
MLKVFAKEAIRANPKELEAFAWRYFEKLAATVKLDNSAPPPTIPQVRYDALKFSLVPLDFI